MIFVRLQLLLLLLLSYSSVLAGGPWTLAKGGGYAQLSFSSISGKSLFNNEGDSYQLYRQVADRTLQAYLEYGLTDKLTLTGNIPLKFVATGEETFDVDTNLIDVPFPAGNLAALGNISFAAKYKIVDHGWLMSVQLRADAATMKYDAATGLQTGNDCWSFQPLLLAGYSRNNWYAYISAGATIRTTNYSESLNVTGEAGYGFFDKKTYLILVLDLDKSFLNDSTQRADYLRTGLYVNNQEFFAYGLKINQSLGAHWNINGGFFGAAYGNLVAEAPSFNIGVAYRW